MKAYLFIGSSAVEIIQTEPYAAIVEVLYVDPMTRGQGIARKLMTETCKDADREFVTLYLKPQPFCTYEIETESFFPPSLTHKQLCAFYRTFGFRLRPKPYENTMMRKPRR